MADTGVETGVGGAGRDEAARLFVALDLSPTVRRSVAHTARDLERRLPDARWVPEDNLHLTLAFLGSRPVDDIPSLVEALASAAAAATPFSLRLDGGGTFPPHRPARVAWVGLTAPPELMALHAGVADALEALGGWERDRRPFHPHVTVARPRRPWNRETADRFVRAFAGRSGDPFPVREVVLYRSRLGPERARYAAEARLPLGEPPA